MENIRPSADLRNKYSEMSRFCRESREPIYFTVNGRGDTVLMNVNDYRQMTAELELLRTLAEGEEDIRNGRVTPADEVLGDLQNYLSGKRV